MSIGLGLLLAVMLVVGVMAAAFTGCSSGQSDPVTLTLGYPFPAKHPLRLRVLEPWATDVLAATDGAVTIEFHAEQARLRHATAIVENRHPESAPAQWKFSQMFRPPAVMLLSMMSDTASGREYPVALRDSMRASARGATRSKRAGTNPSSGAGRLVSVSTHEPDHPMRTCCTATPRPGARESRPSAVISGIPCSRATAT